MIHVYVGMDVGPPSSYGALWCVECDMGLNLEAHTGVAEPFAETGVAEPFADSGIAELYADSGIAGPFADSGIAELIADMQD